MTGLKNVRAVVHSLNRDKNGVIIEPLRVVTHSMGAAFGKGFIQAIIDFATKNKELLKDLKISEYDFAPYQPYHQQAVNGVATFQYSHNDDSVAGADRIKGANYMKPSNAYGGHSINSFLDEIKRLPEGNYRYMNGTFVKQ